MKNRVFAAACAAWLFAGSADAQPAAEVSSALSPADPAALQGAADYANRITLLVQEAMVLMTAMIKLSGQYLLGFTEPATYQINRDANAASLGSLEERLSALSAKIAAHEDPSPGPYSARGLELKRYLEKFVVDMADMKSALDRLPGLVDAGDAEGFDAARAVIIGYSSNSLIAENAMLTAGQLAVSLGHPEYHLIEAMKNSNLVIANFLNLVQRANSGEREGIEAVADEVGAYHKGIYISIDAASALAEKLGSRLVVEAPALKAETQAFLEAYRMSFEVERRIGSALADYPIIANEIAKGAAPKSFKSRLDEIGVAFQPLVAERLSALQAKQKAAVALASNAQ